MAKLLFDLDLKIKHGLSRELVTRAMMTEEMKERFGRKKKFNARKDPEEEKDMVIKLPILDKHQYKSFLAGSGYNSKSMKASSSMSLEHLLRYIDHVIQTKCDFDLNPNESADTFI